MDINMIFENIEKSAYLKTPTKEEAEKENIPEGLAKIKCENCGYEGYPKKNGECPRCFSVAGIKPTTSVKPKPEDYVHPEDKPIDYQAAAEADDRETNPI